MRRPWEVVASPEVDHWTEGLPEATQLKLLRMVSKIEIAGRQAGYPAIEKYGDDLYSTRIDDWRLFGAFRGRVYYMVRVIAKAKPRLSPKQVTVLRDQVQRYLAGLDATGDR